MLSVVALLLVAVAVEGFNPEFGYPPMQNPDLFEGDMVVDGDINERNAISNAFLKWPGGVVPYVIDYSLSGITSKITAAMNDYHGKTCIKFVPRTNQPNYIRMFMGEGCYSNVGCIRGRQELSLGNGCHFVGTIVHELGHALGFYHEQNRSDRDQYLKIYWNNIQQEMQSQFSKLLPSQNTLYTPFDYSSIMIYGNYAFTKSRGLKTMEATTGVPLHEPYEKYGMTSSDAQRVNKLYC